MKYLLLSTLWLAGPCLAAEPSFVYQGEVAGLFCSACSAHVKSSLMTIKGVKEVKIKMAPEGQLPKLTLIATTDQLTREDAVRALGDKAKSFDVRTLNLVSPTKMPPVRP
ncbi:heavy-metal-associated domain-containing protein [Prosthecobacter dejongeii]|uniref:Copper chaperone CopZ n=1 Tax=Prosthecobacter dejongeii TaxID=48465 RepID=A0A7W7YPV7_9BACT|nr:heavy-metal-associated domain-containing protein [Prosthecobacter dejongeii]MBB5040171.1 copper chaperone CopZ [Prosthecobacter dejongeii]